MITKTLMTGLCAAAMLFPHVAKAACSSPTGAEGDIVYNSTHHMMQFCDNTDWVAMAGMSGGGGTISCPFGEPNSPGDLGVDFNNGAIWGNGTSIFVLQNDSTVRAYQFNGTTWTVGTTAALTAQGTGIWSNATHVFVTAGAAGVKAFTYNSGTDTWSAAITYNTAGNANRVWGDGTYIYVADGASGVSAFTFNGTTWTLISTYNTPGNAEAVWGDGTYIYVADNTSGLRALTFNGTTWTSLATQATGDITYDVWGDGTYVYMADNYAGLKALSFNGTAFTLRGTWAYGAVSKVFVKSGFIYIAQNAIALTFDGTTFTTEGSFPAQVDRIEGIWSDGTYVYALNWNDGVMAYPGCH